MKRKSATKKTNKEIKKSRKDYTKAVKKARTKYDKAIKEARSRYDNPTKVKTVKKKKKVKTSSSAKYGRDAKTGKIYSLKTGKVMPKYAKPIRVKRK